MNYEQFTHTIGNDTKKIFLVDMTKEVNYHFSELVHEGIAKYCKQGKRIVIIVNKKGYASGILCYNCGHVPQCKNCSVSISYHTDTNNNPFGLCHICKTQYDIPKKCPACGSDKIRPYGIGIQQVAEMITKEYGITPLIIDSDKVNSPTKIQKMLKTGGEADIPNTAPKGAMEGSRIILGTSLLTTPIQNQHTDLVIFLNADMGLTIPDYTAAQKNFYFLYEAFQKYKKAHFIVQTFNPQQYSIRAACNMDVKKFTQEDNTYREKHGYPPFADLCVLLYKHEIEERLYAHVDKLHKELLYYKEKYELPDIDIYTTPPLIYKKFGKYRYNIILKGPQLRNFVEIIYTKCKLAQKGFKVDRQADSVV